MNSLYRRSLIAIALAAALAFTLAVSDARAHTPAPSDASAASAVSVAVPVALSMAGPAILLSGAATLTVVSVEASAAGTVWVLERASDGARWVLRFGVEGAAAASVAAGAVITCTALSTGWLLSAAGEAIAFVPNAIGASLLHNEQVTR
jgi:hypothetical protein